MKILLHIIVLLLFCPLLIAQNDEWRPQMKSIEKTKVLLIGVFHFDDKGLDDYKSQHKIDISSNERQQELEDITSKLQNFNPTKIGLEFNIDRQVFMDSLYQLYLNNQFKLPTNEIYQLGFRIAKQNRIETIYGIDARGKSYQSITELSEEAYQAKAKKYIQLGLKTKPNTHIWDEDYKYLYTYEDSLKTQIPLKDFLLYINSEERVKIGHGHYLVDSFKFGIGKDNDYFGADAKTSWFNRNLRILQNIYRIIDSTEDRVVIIIGSGHLPILQQLIEASPELELIQLNEVLNNE